MAPARRQNYARSRSRSYNNPPYTPLPPPPPPPNQDLMPPSSRYLHNLRVIQRHDPSITSLFDQFPHVCVYHHKGDEWKKKGCEGAMFLFEREEEPKYGFYILNRNNTGDYIQRMTPNDDVEFASAYLIYRAFGKVTSDTIGLWTMVTQDREAMSQVMMRLHSYIKHNIRYPDEYRRRPDTWSTTPAPAHAQPLHLPSPSTQTNASSMSALSALLAKLGSPPETPSDPSPPSRTVSASVPPPATGIPLLDSIFASASEGPSPSDTIPQAHSPGGSVFHTIFANGIAANGSSSSSTSCGPTPTQQASQLPTSRSSSRPRPHLNGSHLPGLVRTVTPQSQSRTQNGKPAFAQRASSGNPRINGEHVLNGQRHSGQHPPVPRPPEEDDEEAWEEEAGASASVGVGEEAVDQRPSPRRNRKAKKRERERERRRMLKQGITQDPNAETAGTEWPLVDDRSLSMDDDDVDEESVGLGDGLLTALAVVGQTDVEVQDPDQERGGTSKRGKPRERGKDRWKRRQGSQPPDSDNVKPGSHVVEMSHALVDAYGQRRRVGDGVLDEEGLVKEIVGLIHSDPAFVRELHQQYLRKVQL